MWPISHSLLISQKIEDFGAPMERRNDKISINSHQMAEYSKFWAQVAGFLCRTSFYLHWQGLGGLNTRRGQKIQSISNFCENHQDSETTQLDQKSFSFSVTDRLNPKLAIWSSYEVGIRYIAIFFFNETKSTILCSFFWHLSLIEGCSALAGLMLLYSTQKTSLEVIFCVEFIFSFRALQISLT